MRTSYGALAAGAGAAVLSGLVLGVDGLQTWEKPSSFPGVSSLVSEAFCLDHNHDMSSKAPIEPPVRGAELKLVQVIFRHGARTPLTQRYWSGTKWDVCGRAYERPPMIMRDMVSGQVQDKCRDSDNLVHYEGGCTKGELTLLGQIQALEVGQWLKSRYVNAYAFLPLEWQPGAVTARTTNIRRTRDTLHGVLTGMYPGTTEPMEVGTSSKLNEILVANVDACDRLGVLYKQARAVAGQEAKSNDTVVALDQRIRHVLGLNLESEQDRISWTELHDAMTSLQAHQKSVPNNLTEDDFAIINKQATGRMLALVGDAAFRDILKLSMGRLLHMIATEFDAAAEGGADRDAVGTGSQSASAQPRMLLYSGHDTTLMPLLLALGQDLTDWPPYMSHLVIELWTKKGPEGKGENIVRVLYNQSEIKLPGAPGLLTLDKFKEQTCGSLALSQDEHASLCTVAKGVSTGSIDTTSY